MLSLLSVASGLVVHRLPHPVFPVAAPNEFIRASATEPVGPPSELERASATEPVGPPSELERAALAKALPSPALQPRELITTMMHALHASSWDSPRPYFGFEVALRFLSPSHQCYGVVPRDFYRYLRQPHKQGLIEWAEYRWEGDPMIIDDEAYQQVGVRSEPGAPWSSVRWMLSRYEPDSMPHSMWAVDAVFVSEPDEPAESADADAAMLWGRGDEVLPPGEALNLFAEFDADGNTAPHGSHRAHTAHTVPLHPPL